MKEPKAQRGRPRPGDFPEACELTGPAGQLTDERLAAVKGETRPSRPNGKREAWYTAACPARALTAATTSHDHEPNADG
jgi:hypothetical protein